MGAPTAYLPQPCVLHPERVFEYPDRWELTAARAKQLAASPELAAVAARVGHGLPDDGSRPGDGASLYQRWLAAVPGTKVGGHPDWVQEPRYPTCEFCGVPIAHLLSLASWEWDGGSRPRWMPAEHREQDRFRAGKAAGWIARRRPRLLPIHLPRLRRPAGPLGGPVELTGRRDRHDLKA